MNRREFLFLATLTGISLNTSIIASTDMSNVKSVDVNKLKNLLLSHKLNRREVKSNKILKLKLYNPDTGEFLISRFKKDKPISQKEKIKINKFLRDFRENKIKNFDDNLIKNLAILFHETNGKFIVINSGYRTLKTNNYLRTIGFKTAPKSLHMRAKAIDFRISGIDSEQIYKVAKRKKFGGVGCYNNFIHIDSGRYRTWNFT